MSRTWNASAIGEYQPGIFRLKAIAFLQFQEDPIGIFANLKSDTGQTRATASAGIRSQARKASALFEGAR